MSRAPSASKTGQMANKARINVVYYSMYGHIATCKYRLIRLKIDFFFLFIFQWPNL